MGNVGFWKTAQGHDDFGTTFAQDGSNLVRCQKRVDGGGDACDPAADQRQRRFRCVGKQIGHHIRRANAQTAKQIGGLNGLVMKLLPTQGLGRIFWPRCQLKGHRISIGEPGRNRREQLIQSGWHVAVFPCRFRLDRFHVDMICKADHLALPLACILPWKSKNKTACRKRVISAFA